MGKDIQTEITSKSSLMAVEEQTRLSQNRRVVMPSGWRRKVKQGRLLFCSVYGGAGPPSPLAHGAILALFEQGSSVIIRHGLQEGHKLWVRARS